MKRSVDKKNKDLTVHEGMFATPAAPLQILFINQLRTIFWAETEIKKLLSASQTGMASSNVKSILHQLIDASSMRLTRLQYIFKVIGIPARGKRCYAVQGQVEEFSSVLAGGSDGPSRNAGIINLLQKMGHYQIASYKSLTVFAQNVGKREIQDLLELNLADVREYDKKLNMEFSINYEILVNEIKISSMIKKTLV
ncbi:MAG: DUF892 family protein [Chryseobacterium sp.]|nr:MAG: DUF892 family protein [Chryseobacterium sp.]